MESTHLQAHGGNALSAMTSSILLHCAANLVAIRSVATAGVADMIGKCFYCEESSDEECFYCQEVEE